MFIFEAKPAYINTGMIKRGKTNTAEPGLISFFFFCCLRYVCGVNKNESELDP